MDMGLIFPNRRTGDGETEDISSGALLDWRPGFIDRYARKIRHAAFNSAIVNWADASASAGAQHCEELSKKIF